MPATRARRRLELVATQSEVAQLKRDGIAATPIAIDAPDEEVEGVRATARTRSSTSTAPFMEPGGIADEMREIADDNRDVVKLRAIGTSTLGKPISR